MPSGILLEAVMDYFVFTKHDSESVFITVMKDSLCYPIHHQFWPQLHYLILSNSSSVLTSTALSHIIQFVISFDLNCITSYYPIRHQFWPQLHYLILTNSSSVLTSIALPNINQFSTRFDLNCITSYPIHHQFWPQLHYLILSNSSSVLTSTALPHINQFIISFDLNCITSYYPIHHQFKPQLHYLILSNSASVFTSVVRVVRIIQSEMKSSLTRYMSGNIIIYSYVKSVSVWNHS